MSHLISVAGNVFGEEEFVGGRVFAELVFGGRARVNEGLCDDAKGCVHSWRFADVENKVRVFDEVHPEAKRQAVGFPRMDHLRVGDALGLGFVVEEIEKPLDGRGKAVVGTQDGPKKVIDELLDCSLGGEQAGEEHLRDGLVGGVNVPTKYSARGGRVGVLRRPHDVIGIARRCVWGLETCKGRPQRVHSVGIRVMPSA